MIEDVLQCLKETAREQSRIDLDLDRLIEWLSEQDCPESYGFEGSNTFGPCNKCPVCEAKRLLGINPYL